MESYRYLLDVALILLSTKVFGLLTRRIEMPQVVGALVAGLLLGPACFNIVQESEFLDHIAEIGVIVLMFSAGLETDISELKKSGRNSFVIAVIGVLVPLIAGYVLASFFNTEPEAFLQNMFIGVILTATSVSISVETLKEMGKLSTPSGNAILGAALIDDILGIVALTIITGMADTSVQLTEVMLKIVAFFVLAVIVGIFARKGIEKLFDRYQKVHRRFSILSFAFCLLFAYVAEAFFGVADITGAFIAGLIISGTSRCNYVQMRIETLSYLLISPVFFASIGLKVVLPEMSTSIMIFSVLLLVLAILTKIVGCGLGAKLCRYENIQSLRIGIGMVSRGEVALIVASKGIKVGLMNEAFFGPIIIMVVLTTVITPILLKIVFKDRENDPDVYASSELIEDYEKIEQNEKLAQKVLEQS
ncbi:cation:proton antiporter [[Clostridium] innocuum]|nr:cation:proton antiporter [[Clostridium] innocuum]MCR0446880.1 cation:proton antiporter [[Clostridium] innocuum]